MSASTLLVLSGATLRDSLAELLRCGDSLASAQSILDCGVVLERHADGHLIDAHPDFDVPPGVVVTELARERVDPWDVALEDRVQRELRQVLEALHVHTDGDVVVTSDGAHWL